MSDQTTGTSDSDALEKRITELENNVKEIGYMLYDIINELRDQGQLRAIAEPTCPPFCARAQ